MNGEVKRDFADLEETVTSAQAVIVGDLGARIRIRRAQSRLPMRDGWGGADRAAEEPLLVAR